MIYMLIGYMFLYIHRPFEVWEVLATIRLERVYMLATLGSWAFGQEKRWPSNRLNVAVAVFTATVLTCYFVSPWSGTAESWAIVENYLKVFVYFVLLVTSIRNEQDLKRLVWGFVLVMGVYMAHSLREFGNGRHVYRMGIVRMVGVDSTAGDPNSFACTIAYALAMVRPLWLGASRRGRWLLAGYVALSATCIALTGSRTGFTLLGVWAACMVLIGRRKFRMLLMTAVLVPLLWGLLPPSLQNRFQTLIDPKVGPANAQSSAEGRTEGFLYGLALWSRYPLTGCGPGAWMPATGSDIEAHNLYGQVLGETGTLGVLAFAGLLLAYVANVRWASARSRDHPERGDIFAVPLIRAAGLGVVLMLIGGWGGHNLFRYNWLWYASFVIVARRCMEQRMADEGLRWSGRAIRRAGVKD